MCFSLCYFSCRSAIFNFEENWDLISILCELFRFLLYNIILIFIQISPRYLLSSLIVCQIRNWIRIWQIFIFIGLKNSTKKVDNYLYVNSLTLDVISLIWFLNLWDKAAKSFSKLIWWDTFISQLSITVFVVAFCLVTRISLR